MVTHNIRGSLNCTPLKTVDGTIMYIPLDKSANNLGFSSQEEASLADAVTRVGMANVLTKSDIQHVMPFILRMLKSNSEWTK